MLSQLEGECLPTDVVSAIHPFKRDTVKSTQGFQRVASQQSTDDTVGRPMMHLTALQQATGEARYNMYIDDVFAYVNGSSKNGTIRALYDFQIIRVKDCEIYIDCAFAKY